MARFVLGWLIGALTAGLAFACYAGLRAYESRQARTLGHRPYAVAATHDMEPVDRDGKVLLKTAAAKAFRAMQKTAARAKVSLVPLSGHRTIEKQSELFFHGAALNGETLIQRAHVCAPPGHSEHHTGYSLDIADGGHYDSRLELRFKDTKAFRWLAANGARHGFELSFPPGNREGVAYEPWHWRFVGDLGSFEVFFNARFDQQVIRRFH